MSHYIVWCYITFWDCIFRCHISLHSNIQIMTLHLIFYVPFFLKESALFHPCPFLIVPSPSPHFWGASAAPADYVILTIKYHIFYSGTFKMHFHWFLKKLCYYVDKEIREASTSADKTMSEFDVEMRYTRFLYWLLVVMETDNLDIIWYNM
jgi:hypothetical protein